MVRHIRVARGEALDVQFVNDRLGPWCAKQPIAAPAERLVDHHAFRHVRRTVSFISRQIAVRITEAIPEHAIGQPYGIRNGFGVGVDQQFGGIEPMSGSGIIRSVDSIAIMEARAALR